MNIRFLSLLLISIFAFTALQLHASPDENIDDPPIRINELMAVNQTGATDEGGEPTPWIELYNKRDLLFTMVGFFLSDDSTNVFKWEIPQGTQIGSKRFFIIWMDGDEEQGIHHCSFTLNPEGGSLWLVDQEGNVMDRVDYGPQTADLAYARIPNGVGEWVIQDPTYLAHNQWPNSVDELALEQLHLFPNPASSQLTIQFDGSARTEIQVFNAVGHLLWREESQQEEILIDVSGWPSGVYWIRSAKATRSFVVER